jgi:hypothetical protein
MIKATIDGVKFFHIPGILYKKRKSTNSITAQNIKSILKNIPKIRSDLAKYRDTNRST